MISIKFKFNEKVSKTFVFEGDFLNDEVIIVVEYRSFRTQSFDDVLGFFKNHLLTHTLTDDGYFSNDTEDGNYKNQLKVLEIHNKALILAKMYYKYHPK